MHASETVDMNDAARWKAVFERLSEIEQWKAARDGAQVERDKATDASRRGLSEQLRQIQRDVDRAGNHEELGKIRAELGDLRLQFATLKTRVGFLMAGVGGGVGVFGSIVGGLVVFFLTKG